jgi:tetratricopeptide (TPR) repeat protein
MRKAWMLIAVAGLLADCARTPDDSAILPTIPKGAQAVSLAGRPLFPAAPSSEIRQKYEAARKAAEADPGSADALVWHGRWAAYTGDYREAIRIFTRGTERFPSDARFYRHRGHRYISVREFDRAVRDLEKAVSLMEGKPDEIEPDGAPNPRGIPVSTLHSNILYHLGLAYFLKNDLDKALAVCRKGLETAPNDDMRVAAAHWLYMTLRLLGREDEARQALEPVRADMEVIENGVYYRLLLFYKGELVADAVAAGDEPATTNDAAAFGLGNWRFYNGDREGAREIFASILKGDGWASFGFIAAEAAWARDFAGR